MSARLNTAQPYALGLFRIVVGLLFACHGAASLFGILGGAVGTYAGCPRHDDREGTRVHRHGVRGLRAGPGVNAPCEHKHPP